MVDRFTVPLLTPTEAAEHLQIPERTIRYWLAHQAAGRPLVHSVHPERKGWPSVPFVALVEAYVLRALRNLGLSTDKIGDAAADVRRTFGTEYGLANRRITTDGVDVFVHYLETDEIARAGDRQMPFRKVIDDYLRYIVWDDDDDIPKRLTLRKYDPAVAKVVIDPRFAWGAPIVEPARVTVDTILGMWRGGENPDVVADEYGLSVEQVQALIRVAA
ncbi:MAG TPA: DUF433 domain-containing protein [Micromonosporaceae bacterium]|jgi:uncharacterized protein (DUF433 family)|nr:DUF433 domain-containing protein [Micromonosporaceae bacterium]